MGAEKEGGNELGVNRTKPRGRSPPPVLSDGDPSLLSASLHFSPKTGSVYFSV